MKIFGIGMNYLRHTEELDGRAYIPDDPVVFLKADSALLKNGKPFFVPEWAERFDYEAELVLRICRLGKGIPERFAHRYYDAVTVGIDFTARDVQKTARANGMPWAICKGFDNSAAIGEWKEINGGTEVSPETGTSSGNLNIAFHLDLNGQTVQHGNSNEMVFTFDRMVSYLSRFFTLRTGDLIFTGTPPGIGPVHPGDHLEGYIGDERVLDFFCR